MAKNKQKPEYSAEDIILRQQMEDDDNQRFALELRAKLIARKKQKSEYSAEDIIKMVDTKENSTAFIKLRQQMQDDFDQRYALEAYKPTAGFSSYTTPAPKNDFRKVQYAVDTAQLSWKIVTNAEAPQDERKAASQGEELLSGFLNMANRRRQKRGEPPIAEAVTWLGCVRGSIAGKCLIYQNDEGETIFDVEAIDPMLPVWETGQDGLVWWALKYPISKAEVESRWGIVIDGEDDSYGHIGTIIDHFDQKINCVVLAEGSSRLVGNARFLKAPTEHGLDHVPCYIGFAGSMPTVYGYNDKSPNLHLRAMSVWDASRSIYEQYNRQVSFLMDVMERYVLGTLVHISPDGKKLLQGVPWKSAQAIEFEQGETLLPLPIPEAPPETAVIMKVLMQDLQRSAPPFPQAYGLDIGTHSGEALKTLNDHLKSNYGPFTTLKAEFFQWLFQEMLDQFRLKGAGAVTVQGYDSAHRFFERKVTPGEINPGWFLEVSCEPKLPRDEAADVMMALQLTQPGADGIPLIDRQFARENILKIQNPEAVKEHIGDERIEAKILQLPLATAREALAALKKGDRKAAEDILAAAEGGPRAPGGPGVGPPSAPGGVPLTPQEMQAMSQMLMAQGITPQVLEQMAPAQREQMLMEMMARVKGQGGMRPPEGV